MAKVRSRFVVVEFDTGVVHKRTEPCPPWCHLCPHMGGGVMPYCYGSICQNEDEYDILHCNCDPSDPIVAHADLVRRTDILRSLLRDRRRDRKTDRAAVARLRSIATTMRWSTDQRGLSAAWEEVLRIAERLETASKTPQKVDARLTDSEEGTACGSATDLSSSSSLVSREGR